jgi:hypothetical protein
LEKWVNLPESEKHLKLRIYRSFQPVCVDECNYIRHGSDSSSFILGPDYEFVMPKKVVALKAKSDTDLPFGLKWTQQGKAKARPAKKDKEAKDEVNTGGGSKRKKGKGTRGQGSKAVKTTDDAEDKNPDHDDDKHDENDEDEDDNDCYLGPNELAELAKLKSMGKVNPASLEDHGHGHGVLPTVPNQSSGPSGSQQMNQPSGSSGSRPPAVGSANWRHSNVGIQSLMAAKRRANCCMCQGPLWKGDMKFIVIEHTAKSEKSMHTYCATSMRPQLIQPSLESLRACLSTSEAGSLEHDICQETLRRLSKLPAASV